MTKSTAPAFTDWPSAKRTCVMRPLTCGRISAKSTAFIRPENSDQIITSSGLTVFTLTGVAGMTAGGASAGCALALV